MKTLLCIIIALGTWTSAFAATPSSAGKSGNTASSTSVQNISQSELELKVLQAQSATMKEYHSSLLDTVYWALATVATVSVLLVGFGWFANFKFHEAEKQRLKEELEARLKEAMAALETRLGSYEADVVKLVDSRLDAFLTRVTRDIDIARADAERSAKENSGAIEQLRGIVQTLQDSDKKSAQQDSDLEAKLRHVEEQVWNIKGIPTNTLVTQAQGLSAAVHAENRWYIASTLDRMQATLKTILSAKTAISKTSLTFIEASLARAEATEPIAVSNVRELLKQVPVEPEQQT